MATLNIGMKVNRAITGGTTVSANAYAMVTYNATAFSGSSTVGNGLVAPHPPITRYFGPGQSIPASFAIAVPMIVNGSVYPASMGYSLTYTLQSGVELINTI